MNPGFCLQNSKIYSSVPSSQSLYPITPFFITGKILFKQASIVTISFFTLINAQGSTEVPVQYLSASLIQFSLLTSFL